jgi:hypothetical protein
VTLKLALIASLILLLASAAPAQTPAPQAARPPDFSVQIWGDAVVDFDERVQTYADLRARLEAELPVLALAAEPAEIIRAQRALARKIRESRPGTRRGHIFTPEITTAFRAGLGPEMTARTLIRIMDENPGEFSVRVDSTYPKERTLSSVPPNILAVLPLLPEDIQYRFLGRHLILYDARANTVIDRMPCAVRCRR